MIQLNHIKINEIPIIELVDNQLDKEKLPLVVFFHGWTSVKESVLVNGYELAKKGFRALLPEAYKHGERDETGKATQNQLIFWDVVSENVSELQDIVEYFINNGLAAEDRIGVAGLSMGGISTCAAMVQYDWIKAAVCLMGNPDPVGYTRWLLETDNPSELNKTDVTNHPKVDFELEMEHLRTISLSEHPEKINGRPFHFWHGTEDEWVPFEMTEKFIEKTQAEPYGKYLSFNVGEGKNHKVSYDVSVEMADFFEKKL